MQLPPELPAGFHTLLRADRPETPSALLQRVQTYLAEVEQAVFCNEFVDLERARQLGGVSLRLIELLPGLAEPEQRLVRAAIAYFIEDDDAIPDLSSPIGFDDDVQVMDWVVARLGRADLKLGD